jgi:hypothetical protein
VTTVTRSSGGFRRHLSKWLVLRLGEVDKPWDDIPVTAHGRSLVRMIGQCRPGCGTSRSLTGQLCTRMGGGFAVGSSGLQMVVGLRSAPLGAVCRTQKMPPHAICRPRCCSSSLRRSPTQGAVSISRAQAVCTTVTRTGPACVDVKSAIVGRPAELVSQQICSADRSVTRNEGTRTRGDYFGVDPGIGSADLLSCQVVVDGAVRGQGTAGNGRDINCLQKDVLVQRRQPFQVRSKLALRLLH